MKGGSVGKALATQSCSDLQNPIKSNMLVQICDPSIPIAKWEVETEKSLEIQGPAKLT